MKKYISIFLFLAVLGTAGYLFGLRKQTVEVTVNQVSPTSSALLATTTLHFTGEQLSKGVLTDIFGTGIIVHKKNIPWYITRASAVAAYILMFLIIVWGAGMTTTWLYRFVDPTTAWGIHKFFSIAMTILVVIHITALLFDEFIKFGLLDVLVPFAAHFKPLYVGLGIIGFYLIIAVMISSMFFRSKSERVWHFIHYSVYPLFIMILIHGIFTGSDTNTSFMKTIYWFTGIVFAATLIYRFSIYHIKPKK